MCARLLDRRGFAGTATPFVVASLAAIAAGISLLGEDIEAAGAGVALGIVLIIADAMQESGPTRIGIALLIVGAAVAVGAQVMHLQTGETPQMKPGPSVFSRTNPTPGWSAPSAHAPPGSGPSGPAVPPVPPVPPAHPAPPPRPPE